VSPRAGFAPSTSKNVEDTLEPSIDSASPAPVSV
jgi:hypothetical protein